MNPSSALCNRALLVAAVIYAEAGDTRNFAATQALLEQSAPTILKNPRTEIEARLGRQEDVKRVLGSLRKAGVGLE
jgi:hypothetical protein